jgi:hypothetical protein
MRNAFWRSAPAIVVAFCTAGLVLSGAASPALAQGIAPLVSDEAVPSGFGSGTPALPAAVPALPADTQLVYFVPSDNDSTATVISLFNTTAFVQTVKLRGFDEPGLVYAQDVAVPPHALIRLISDSVAASPPPSWSGSNVVVTNFTDFTKWVAMIVPLGIGYDGYTLFNAGTGGTIDPRLDQGAIPLRFSTERLVSPIPPPPPPPPPER